MTFTNADKQILIRLAGELTGASATGELRHDALVNNVIRRMQDTSCGSFVEYLRYVESHPSEEAYLISALTIHTTSWFRENPHFVRFHELLLTALKKQETFRVWCAASSTGEEVYSFALVLEEFRAVHPQFEYEVLGTDIDPVSVAAAERAVYSRDQIGFHLNHYRHHLLEGTGKTDGYFTLSREIRTRCKFDVHDLRSADLADSEGFHVIVCRNVLIYFSSETLNKVVSNLIARLRPGGRLLLGHSEAIPAPQFGLAQEGHCVYKKLNLKNTNLPKRRPNVVLIGASTGGPQALVKILQSLPLESPPLVITQHISPKFARSLGERLAEVSGLKLGSDSDCTLLEPGHIYMSFGDYHVGVERVDGRYRLRVSNSPAFNGHRPSVDYLFNSVLGIRRPIMAILLTGMGRDGATGIRFLRKEGVFCVAQSEEDCVVYGMPREAIEGDAVDFVGNLDEIHALLVKSFARVA
ncbi:MAG: chemotaxis protein CheB [Bdellovibrionales bacterium]